MGRPRGSYKDQIKFPEFVERDGKRYQILIKFSHESGKSRGYLRHLASFCDGGRIESILVDYGTCRRRYIRIDELGRAREKEPWLLYRAKEFVEEDGGVYQIIRKYCEDNHLGLGTAWLRIRHIPKNVKCHLNGKKIKTHYGYYWYVVIGFKRSKARMKYLAMRKGELKLGKRVKKIGGDLDKLVEDCEDD